MDDRTVPRVFLRRQTTVVPTDHIEGVAEYVKLPDGGKGLDVGCGSGALAVAVAKRSPKASFVGIDRWGKEYASFNLPLCEQNAKAEKVKNVTFRRGDATALDFPDESFDAVVSNFVYHNIPTNDRQAVLLCRSGFFPRYYPEVKTLLGPHLFGYNRRSHLIAALVIPAACLAAARICTLI